MKVLRTTDVDNKTILIKDGGGNQCLSSALLLSDQELTVEANNISKFIFRETVNCNYLILCTGFLIGNTWYGDRPDDGQFTNPFTSKVMERKNGEVSEYIPEIKSKFVVEETNQGLKFYLINMQDVFNDKPPVLTNVTYNSNTVEDIDNWIKASDNVYRFDSRSTNVNYKNNANLTFTLDGVNYRAILPKTGSNAELGIFTLEADGKDNWNGIVSQFEKI